MSRRRALTTHGRRTFRRLFSQLLWWEGVVRLPRSLRSRKFEAAPRRLSNQTFGRLCGGIRSGVVEDALAPSLDQLPLNGTPTSHYPTRLPALRCAETIPPPPRSSVCPTTLRAKAIYEGETYEAPVRVAAVGEERWLDLGDDTGRAILIKSSGWEVRGDVPIRFFRSPGTNRCRFPSRSSRSPPVINVSIKESSSSPSYVAIATNGPCPISYRKS